VSAPAFLTKPQEISALDSSLEREWKFLRAAVSRPAGKNLREWCEGVRWSVLFDLAEHHGVQPLLYQALSRTQDLVPEADMSHLARLYHTNLHRALLLARALIHVQHHLKQNNIESLPYKGVALAESFYSDIALRQAGDIDLLIRVQDFFRVRDALRDLGYAPQSSFSPPQQRSSLKSGYECIFDGPAGRNLLEVKWRILPRFYAIDFDYDSLFRRAVPVHVAGHAMKTPSPEDLFLILCVHAAKHVWGRLIWLCDVAGIMQRPELNWTWIAAQSKDLGLARMVRVTLLLVNRLLEIDIPPAAESNLSPDDQAGPLAREIEPHIPSMTDYEVESFAYFRLIGRLRERWRDRGRFSARILLTPGPGEWATLRLPQPLFPLYRLVRLARVASRIAHRKRAVSAAAGHD
jgi:hypothetical protein